MGNKDNEYQPSDDTAIRELAEYVFSKAGANVMIGHSGVKNTDSRQTHTNVAKVRTHQIEIKHTHP